MIRIFVILFAFLLSSPSHAEAGLSLVTGPKTGTYYAFGQDIEALAVKDEMNLQVKESDGSIDNIRRISTHDKADIGIVQSDVLGFLGHSQKPESIAIASHVRVIFPFYREEVHVLARKPIENFKELQSKRVAIGEDGSGHMLTAVNLFAIEQIVPSDIQKVSPEEGVVAVLKGDLDAVIFVGGKPVKMFKNMEDLSKPENQKYALMLQQVHFLPLNNPKFMEEYQPADITPQDYNFVKTPVPTIAVQAVLVSYDFVSASKKRCDAIKKLANLIQTSMPSLVEKGHPKWKEVKLDSPVSGWKRDSCVWGNS